MEQREQPVQAPSELTPKQKIEMQVNKAVENYEQLRQKPRLRPHEVDRLIAEIHQAEKQESSIEGILTGAWKVTVLRVGNETQFFADFKELGLVVGLLAGELEKAPTPAETKFRPPRTDLPWSIGGGYERDWKGKGRAQLYLKPPSSEELIQTLAADGRLPFSVLATFHEQLHSKQESSGIIRGIWDLIIHGLPAPIEVQEAHAYRAMGYPLREAFLGAKKSAYDVLNPPVPIQHAHGRKLRESDKDLVIYSLSIVDRLKALGFSHPEIAEIVGRPGNFDKKRELYPKLERLIAKEMKKGGLDEEDLDNLVTVSQLERKIAQLQAQDIAQKEVQKAAETASIKT